MAVYYRRFGGEACSALVSEVNVPIQLHCHASSGMATSTYVEGVRAGAGRHRLRYCVMAGTSSQPRWRRLLRFFRRRLPCDLDREAMLRCTLFCRTFPETQSRYVAAVLHRPPDSHPPIPGGMISNFVRSFRTELISKLEERYE